MFAPPLHAFSWDDTLDAPAMGSMLSAPLAQNIFHFLAKLLPLPPIPSLITPTPRFKEGGANLQNRKGFALIRYPDLYGASLIDGIRNFFGFFYQQPSPLQSVSAPSHVASPAQQSPAPLPVRTALATPTPSMVQPIVQITKEIRTETQVKTIDDSRFTQLLNLIDGLSSRQSQTQSSVQANTQTIALTNRINELQELTIKKGLTLASGGLDITNGNINISSGNITLSSGSISAATSSVSSLSISGTGSFGGMLTVSSGGAAITGNVGIGTSTPSDTFALNGAAYFAQISAPVVSSNRLQP